MDRHRHYAAVVLRYGHGEGYKHGVMQGLHRQPVAQVVVTVTAVLEIVRQSGSWRAAGGAQAARSAHHAHVPAYSTGTFHPLCPRRPTVTAKQHRYAANKIREETSFFA